MNKLSDNEVLAGLKKIANDMYDPSQYSKLQQMHQYGASFPTFGSMAGASAATASIPWIMGNKKIHKYLKVPLAGGLVLSLGSLGLLTGIEARQARKRKFISTLPENDPFRIGYLRESERLKGKGIRV